jgi:hypothetical protein
VIDVDYPREGKCRAKVWVKDTYRRTGRGLSGFEMHYTARQCKRLAKGCGYCLQHHQLVNSR